MTLWTPEHIRSLLPALGVMILVAMVLRHFLKDKPLRVRMIPIQILTVLLVLAEIGKQVLSFARGYDLYHIPLHFCSLFIFLLPVMAFYRGVHQEKVFAITSSLCMSMTLLLLIYPSLIYSAGNIRDFFHGYFDFHTVFFHNIVLFVTILIVTLCPHTGKSKGLWRPALVFTLVYCIIAAVMAQVLQVNFNNFYSCNVPPLEDLRISMQGTLGYWPTQILYVLIVTVLDIGFVQLSLRLHLLLRRIVNRRTICV